MTQYPVKISVENSKICGFESISKMMVVFFPFSLAHPVFCWSYLNRNEIMLNFVAGGNQGNAKLCTDCG